MSSLKYHYNPKTFQYERARLSVRDCTVVYNRTIVYRPCCFVVECMAIHDSLIETESERALRIENKLLEKHKPILEQQLAAIDTTLAGLKNEDKVLYASLFNTKASGNIILSIPPYQKNRHCLPMHQISDVLLGRLEIKIRKALEDNRCKVMQPLETVFILRQQHLDFIAIDSIHSAHRQYST